MKEFWQYAALAEALAEPRFSYPSKCNRKRPSTISKAERKAKTKEKKRIKKQRRK